MTEYEIQKAIFEWAAIKSKQYPELKLLNSSLNGLKLSIGQAMKAKRGGMKKGYPDINLPSPKLGYNGLFIELKVKKGGVISKEQKWWLEKLNDQGYYATVCKGYDEAIKTITDYLEYKIKT